VTHEAFLELAIDEAAQSVRSGGGPFGAVIVRHGRVIARGQNRVTLSLDPTAHAEIVAIRTACQAVGSHELHGVTLYASTEPCPLCLAAVYWAHIDRVFYATTRDDAAAAGFDDADLYRELALPPAERRVRLQRIEMPSASKPLRAWIALPDKVPY
jgi:guanine deaminase